MGQPLSANRSNLQAVTVAHRYAAFGSGNIDAAAKVTFDFFDGLTGEWAHSHGTWQLVETRKMDGEGRVAVVLQGWEWAGQNDDCPCVPAPQCLAAQTSVSLYVR